MTDKKTLIAVIGGSRASADELKLAEEVGRELAQRGAILVCGGLGGVMEAACRGTDSAGGTTIGIIPTDSRCDANDYVQISIVTGMGYARNVIVVKSAQAVIAIGGSFGTLSELGHALQSGVPVIGLGTWSLSRNGQANNDIIPADNAIDAVNKAFDYIAD